MIAIGSDHAAYKLKLLVEEHLKEKGVEFEDLGCYGPERVDYPVYGQKVAEAVASGQYEAGIVLCGTGIGISLAANKVPGHPLRRLLGHVFGQVHAPAQRRQHARHGRARGGAGPGHGDRGRLFVHAL